MDQQSDDVPLGPALVGVVYNLKHAENPDRPADDQAEYDSIDTVLAIEAAIRLHGIDTVRLEAHEHLAQKLAEYHPDLAFNIAEGHGGRGREAQAPALLSLLNIPFTGSDETTLCLALDKALCKRLLATYHIRTPRYRVFAPGAPVRAAGLRFPVIVKPNAEGSSKGILDACVAETPAKLRALVDESFKRYHAPVLVEEYIEGREFTVGVLGNGLSARVFQPMEIVYHHTSEGGYRVYNYTVKQNYEKYVEYRCPAAISPALEQALVDAARRVFLALGCLDLARVDFRVDGEGRVYFIEINPLPGLAPHYSDYPMLAEFSGLSYDELIMGVLREGAARNGVDLREGR